MKIDRYIGFQKNQIGFREVRAGERSGADDPAANLPDAKSSTNGIPTLDCSAPYDADASSSSKCLLRFDRLSLSCHSIQLRNLHAALSDVADRRSAGSRRVDPRVPRERHLRGDRPADLTGDVAGFPRLGAQLGTRMRTHISVSWPPLTVD